MSLTKTLTVNASRTWKSVRVSRIRLTPQTQPSVGRDQVKNDAGGYSFQVDKWTMLDRFLILGTENGTYYANNVDLTKQAFTNVLACIGEDGKRVVARTLEISRGGRAPKNDYALFVLALVFTTGDMNARQAAKVALPGVARTLAHLYQFVTFVTSYRGWGRALRSALDTWFYSFGHTELAYQFVKYRQREGWTVRDLLRLSHSKAQVPGIRGNLFHWATKGWEDVGALPHATPALQQIWAYERLKRETDPTAQVNLITSYRLPREAVPTKLLQETRIWQALLADMPLTARIRSLATLTARGVLTPTSLETRETVAALLDTEKLRRARVHPLSILFALRTYETGQGVLGSLKWTPVPQIITSLNDAFHSAFTTVEGTGKRILVAVDVSGSMQTARTVGPTPLSACEAAGALALTFLHSEPQAQIVAFDTAVKTLPLHTRMSLREATLLVKTLSHGGTDCSAPIQWALNSKLDFDAIIILTDSQTWYGDGHPVEWLERYEKAVGHPVKLASVAMATNQFSIVGKDSANYLTAVGFDAQIPTILNGFIAGEF